MKLYLFSVFDAKAAAFNAPFTAPSFGVAERNFHTEVTNTDSFINKYPEDYSLFVIGEMDTDTGMLTSRPPEAIVTASSLLTKVAN